MLSVLDFDDFRHPLEPTQHEAFYFQFASSDGQTFGFLRTLFGYSTVLEIVAVQAAGSTWVFQRGTPLSGGFGASYDASGSTLRLICLESWVAWRCVFNDQVTNVASNATTSLSLDFQFQATGPATRYRIGPYQQAQQDGRMKGSLTLNGQTYPTEYVCSRDRSWGERQMNLADDWLVASVPQHLYLALIHADHGQMHIGHYFSAPDQRTALTAPIMSVYGHLLNFQDHAAGLGSWEVERVVQPFVVYLGPPGREAIRNQPRPGDLYRDELGPAMYTAPDGRKVLGFLELARRLR